jgi:ribosomal protein L21
VRVEATVIERAMARAKIHQKFRKRENFRKIRYSREQYTLLRINDIEIKNKID